MPNSSKYFQYTLAELKKSSDRKLFNVVSFFAGGGGSSCGYKLAGGNMICVNEFQQIHADTYSANWPDTPVIVDDIRKIEPQQILQVIGGVEIDILDGSPPCPPFSMSGTKRKGWGKEKMAYGAKMKNIEDLTFEQVRLVKTLQPKVVICENVKGLTMDYARDYLNMMIKEFEDCGYIMTHKVLNAWEHGVPQKRQRVFMVGVRNDIADKIGMNWMTINSIYPEPDNNGKPVIEDAIRDLQTDPKNVAQAKELCEAMTKSAKYKWLKRLEKNPENVASVGDNVVKPWYEKLIAHRVRMIERVEGYSKPVPEAKFSFFQSRRVPWHQASHTLSEQGLMTSLAVHLHPAEDRVYTTYEAARLMTLPNDYIQTGSLNDKLARIGLMVAPICLKNLVESIYTNVLEPCKQLS